MCIFTFAFLFLFRMNFRQQLGNTQTTSFNTIAAVMKTTSISDKSFSFAQNDKMQYLINTETDDHDNVLRDEEVKYIYSNRFVEAPHMIYISSNCSLVLNTFSGGMAKTDCIKCVLSIYFAVG